MPNFGLEELASRSVAWWAIGEVSPIPTTRCLRGDRLRINYIPNNRRAVTAWSTAGSSTL